MDTNNNLTLPKPLQSGDTVYVKNDHHVVTGYTKPTEGATKGTVVGYRFIESAKEYPYIIAFDQSVNNLTWSYIDENDVFTDESETHYDYFTYLKPSNIQS